MKTLNKEKIKNLSFEDFNVEKMIFSNNEKTLRIFVDGAWFISNDISQLGKGILFFNDWERLTINRYNPNTEEWSTINELTIEPLQDICEMKFFDSTICLYGFGKKIGYWMEWKIYKTKIRAEFDS